MWGRKADKSRAPIWCLSKSTRLNNFKVVHNNYLHPFNYYYDTDIDSESKIFSSAEGPYPGVNRTENGIATAASVEHKCYSFTTIMYYLKIVMIEV